MSARIDGSRAGRIDQRRRMFLTGAAAALFAPLSRTFSSDTAGAPDHAAIDFSRSFLQCAPNKSGIWVRIQMECLCELRDNATRQSRRFALGVVAKTGLKKDDRTGELNPGYDYWLILSSDRIYTRRSHASVYLKNPTLLTVSEFGAIGWKLHETPASPLTSAADVRQALQGWRRLVARTQITSTDGSRTFTVDYPVKWADCNIEAEGYRVETGPVIILDPNRYRPDDALNVEDFQWTHLDFRSPDRIRCLIERPTGILSEAGFFPPREDKRDERENPPLTPAQIKSIEDRLYTGWETPIPAAAMRQLFQTDHYSSAEDLASTNWLFAID